MYEATLKAKSINTVNVVMASGDELNASWITFKDAEKLARDASEAKALVVLDKLFQAINKVLNDNER
jgi:hypothetical protein